MKKLLLLPLTACVAVGAQAEILSESKISSAPITSVGLYKNGLALVSRTVRPGKDGIVWLDGAVRPCYGLFWNSSSDPVQVRAMKCDVRRDLSAVAADDDWARVFADREVTLSFRGAPALAAVLAAAQAEGGYRVKAYSLGEKDEAFELKGRVLRPEAKLAVPRRADSYRYYYLYSASDEPTAASIVLKLATGSTVTISQANVFAVRAADGAGDALERDRPLWQFSGSTSPYIVRYLCEGACWTPSYRLVLDGKKGRLDMAAEICNEIADWHKAEVSLISGFPALRFAPVHSLVGAGMNFNEYRRQHEEAASSDPWNRRRSVGAMSQVMSNSILPREDEDSGADYSAREAGAGADVHYRPIGKVTLKKGEVLSLPLGSAGTGVERIVDWDLVDPRDETGRKQSGESQAVNTLWDAVKLKNPFDFPMTTAPIVVEEGGRILGQSQSFWTNPGDEMCVRVTKALSVQGMYEERSDSGGGKFKQAGANGAGEQMRQGFHTYRKEIVTGTFRVRNFRTDSVQLNIRKAIAGEIIEISEKPSSEKVPPAGDNQVNVPRELRWNFTLKAGEAHEVTLTYSTWVRL